MRVVEFWFANSAEAKSVYEVVDHRVMSVPNEMASLSDPEVEEVFRLVGFLHRLKLLIQREGEE